MIRNPIRETIRSPVWFSISGAVPEVSDLQRLLALSPSLLIWPANGAGWQGTSGGTLAASGQPLGLGADLSQLEGKTLNQWLAAPTTADLWDNASVVFGGEASEVSQGVYRIFSSAGTNSFVNIASVLTIGRAYLVKFNVDSITTLGAGVRIQDSGEIFTTTGAKTSLLIATANNAFIKRGGTVATDIQISGVEFYEIPGNHLRAGTWASPSDAARATLQVSGGVTWIDPDATSDAYSFLTALSARAIVARVRVPTGYSNADRFLTNDAETVNVSADAGSWTNTGSGSTRVNGASGAEFAVDTWQTLTIEWGSGQAFSRMWFSATGTLFGSMDVASLAVFNSALTTGDRAIAEAVIGATA